jgi:hypothetical protein
VIFDKTDALYGTTSLSPNVDGCGISSACGTVYKLSRPAQEGAPWQEDILYTFGDQSSDGGGEPFTGLVFDPSGNLYGSDLYAIYQLTPPAGGGTPWTATLPYSDFSFSTLSTPLRDPSGNLYFTSFSSSFLGKVTQLTFQSGTWSSSTIYSFTGNADGEDPADGVIQGHDGSLYGTTLSSRGNPNFCGSIYQLTPDSTHSIWTEATLHTFSGPDGCGGTFLPMFFDAKGNLYGTSQRGGASTNCAGGCGVIFELSPPVGGAGWRFRVLYSFLGGNDGAGPQGLVMDRDGALYGATIQGGTGTCVFNGQSVGCGTIFKLSPPSGGGWSETVLHSFQGGLDGAQPFGGVTIGPDGALYGTTNLFGAYHGGTVFRIPR